jgi:hypothetical protein
MPRRPIALHRNHQIPICPADLVRGKDDSTREVSRIMLGICSMGYELGNDGQGIPILVDIRRYVGEGILVEQPRA